MDTTPDPPEIAYLHHHEFENPRGGQWCKAKVNGKTCGYPSDHAIHRHHAEEARGG